MSSEELGALKPGDKHYKAYIGPPLKYDLIGAMQFNLLTSFGLRDFHKLLDVGCGSLRSGKLFIPYLKAGNYYGVEPNKWLISEGIKHELGDEIISLKAPKFSYSSNFDFQSFNTQFDFIIAQSIFSHASKEQISQCLQQARLVLKKDGIFLATFVIGNKNYTGSDWVYPGCVTYRHSFVLNLIEEQNLQAVKTKWYHPNEQKWYIIFHPENKERISAITKRVFTFNKTKFSFRKYARRQKLLNNPFTRKVYRLLK